MVVVVVAVAAAAVVVRYVCVFVSTATWQCGDFNQQLKASSDLTRYLACELAAMNASSAAISIRT